MSVLVAMVISILAVMTIGLVMFSLAARGIKKQLKAGRVPKCPMPGCPFHQDIEKAMNAAKGEA